MAYTFETNDGVAVEIPNELLVFMEAFNWIATDGVDPSEPFPVPGIHSKQLYAVKHYLECMLHEDASKYFIQPRSPIKTDSEIMEDGRIGTGFCFVYVPPLMDETHEWSETSLGVAQSLLDCVADKSLSDLIELYEAGYYLSIKSLCHVVAAKLAHNMIQNRECIYQRCQDENPRYFVSSTTKLEYFKRWIASAPNNDPVYTFFQTIQSVFSARPYIKREVMSLQKHRGLPVPRENWTRDDWNRFKSEATEFYKHLE